MVITIITITKDDPSQFQKTSHSLSSQIDSSFQWVIKDGSSIPGYADKLSEWCSHRYLVVSSDTGIYNAMNQALAAVHCGWTIFLNSGDQLSSACVISDLRHSINRLSLDLSHNYVILGSTVHSWPNAMERVAPPKSLRACSGIFSYRIPCVHQSMVFSPKVMAHFRYDESYRITGDGHFFWKIVNAGAQVVYLPIVISKFEHGGRSMYYFGFHKQREVLRFASEYKLCPLLLRPLLFSLSLFTTLAQRLLYRALNLFSAK